jgi:hypothetical protein
MNLKSLKGKSYFRRAKECVCHVMNRVSIMRGAARCLPRLAGLMRL